VPEEESTPVVAAHRHPDPADRDRTKICPAINDPVPDGTAVVGTASPPARTRTNKVTRRGPVPAPNVPPPPDSDAASVHPDGVDGVDSVEVPDTTSSTANCPAVVDAGYVGLTLAVP
jgi:hypothetical protein